MKTELYAGSLIDSIKGLAAKCTNAFKEQPSSTSAQVSPSASDRAVADANRVASLMIKAGELDKLQALVLKFPDILKLSEEGYYLDEDGYSFNLGHFSLVKEAIRADSDQALKILLDAGAVLGQFSGNGRTQRALLGSKNEKLKALIADAQAKEAGKLDKITNEKLAAEIAAAKIEAIHLLTSNLGAPSGSIQQAKDLQEIGSEMAMLYEAGQLEVLRLNVEKNPAALAAPIRYEHNDDSRQYGTTPTPVYLVDLVIAKRDLETLKFLKSKGQTLERYAQAGMRESSGWGSFARYLRSESEKDAKRKAGAAE